MPNQSSNIPSQRHWSTISEPTSDEPLTMLTKMLQRVGVATDHGGFELKEQLVGKLRAAVFDLSYEFCPTFGGK